jgi:hypothetical protein
MSAQCPWKIRWTSGQDAQCRKPAHEFSGDHQHEALLPNGITVISWFSADRREFTGEWPGPCAGRTPGCILHAGHHGRCAP